MTNKRNPSSVKVCNHKPGENWEKGCCKDKLPKNIDSEVTVNQQVQEKQESERASHIVLSQSDSSPSSAT